ncbi:MAG: ATP-binding cassette domain-containing protein [Candidatus Omnitrophica bacterium]|nr:ATP-binding cassette domain-containing protein [Candidatus Omnitrophota bacterium]MBD3269885.1 ATP-binding cassette domain-containing protein [Candidatus Omnitrophota bacterium]
MAHILDIYGLSKNYRSGNQLVQALRNINFEVSEAEYVSIVGPSGVGKSTFLHLLGGLDVPTGGRVMFRGRDIFGLNDKQRSLWRGKHIGFVFQFFHLIEELNVIENIQIGAGSFRRKYTFKKAQELLEYLDIVERAHFFPSQLSGGEKQKVALARALMNDPEVILCDEPTGNLDRDSQSKVSSLLKSLNREKKKCIVLVTHNPDLAGEADRVFYMRDGRIRANPQEFY